MREDQTQALLAVLLPVISGDEIVFPSPLLSCYGADQFAPWRPA
jgi:hypothetical protein